MSRRRNPIGSPRRWREGHAQRVEATRLQNELKLLQQAIATRIATTARERDISASEMAAAIGVSPSMAVKWSNGRATPTLVRLLAIATALRCAVCDLLPHGVEP